MGINLQGLLVLEYLHRNKLNTHMQASLVPMKGREAGQRKYKPEEQPSKKSSRNDQRRKKHEEKRSCSE